MMGRKVNTCVLFLLWDIIIRWFTQLTCRALSVIRPWVLQRGEQDMVWTLRTRSLMGKEKGRQPLTIAWRQHSQRAMPGSSTTEKVTGRIWAKGSQRRLCLGWVFKMKSSAKVDRRRKRRWGGHPGGACGHHYRWFHLIRIQHRSWELFWRPMRAMEL